MYKNEEIKNYYNSISITSGGLLLIGPYAAKPFSNYKVYIQAFNSFKWGGDDIQYFANVSMYDGC